MAELIWKGKEHVHGRQTEDLLHPESIAGPAHHHLVTNTYHLPQEPCEESTAWFNRLIWGDRHEVLPALLEDFTETIDLIYIDPPFMTGRTFSKGEGIAYSDTWNNDLDAYLQWLYETLLMLHALLAPDGSLYIHLDWRTVHYAKIMLDEIFTSHTDLRGGGFKNEIIWHYRSGGRAQHYYARKHDTLLLYTKSAHYCFHSERVSARRGLHKRNHMRKEVGENGQITWTIRSAGRVYSYNENTLVALSDVWSDISHLHQKDPERMGYATQKPEALLERVILASSEENDLVLDCFCGSGVTPLVAERLKRRWIAGDQSAVAIKTIHERLLSHSRVYPFAVQHIAEARQASRNE